MQVLSKEDGRWRSRKKSYARWRDIGWMERFLLYVVPQIYLLFIIVISKMGYFFVIEMIAWFVDGMTSWDDDWRAPAVPQEELIEVEIDLAGVRRSPDLSSDKDRHQVLITDLTSPPIVSPRLSILFFLLSSPISQSKLHPFTHLSLACSYFSLLFSFSFLFFFTFLFKEI